jgi:hypothetical protein
LQCLICFSNHPPSFPTRHSPTSSPLCQADPKQLTPELKALTESFGISARLAPHVKGRVKKMQMQTAAPRPPLKRRLPAAADSPRQPRAKSPPTALSALRASAPVDDWPSARKKSAREDDDD